MRGLQLVVADAAAARDELLARGVEASELRSFGDQDGSTFFGFADPDGNTWAVQELKVRADEAAHPAAGARPVRGVLTARRTVQGARMPAGRRARVLA